MNDLGFYGRSAVFQARNSVNPTTCTLVLNPLMKRFGLNNILFIIRYIHAYIQTIQLTIGSDGKHSAYTKVIS